MIEKKFLLHLGQGDIEEVTVKIDENIQYTLKDFTDDVKKSNGWFVVGNKSIQVRHIKKIIQIS